MLVCTQYVLLFHLSKVLLFIPWYLCTEMAANVRDKLESVCYIVQVHIESQSWVYINGTEACSTRDLSPVVPKKQVKINQCSVLGRRQPT